MSISYEEALSTLQAMFGEPWTRDSLDAVLRHFQGHMENTVEALLGHGGQDPQVLLDKLKNGSSGNNNSTSLDEQLARQLSTEAGNGFAAAPAAPAAAAAAAPPAAASAAGKSTGSSSSTNNNSRRGTPTTLPDDFLRVKTSTNQATLDSDEALARMLQDQLFSEELRRNPDFAHLAGRRPSNHGAQQQQQPAQSQAANRTSFTARGHQPMPMPNIMEKLSEMGTSAKFKLAQMAEQFKANTNRLAAGVGNNGNANDGNNQGNEMRGLLDRDDSYDAYELASRKDL